MRVAHPARHHAGTPIESFDVEAWLTWKGPEFAFAARTSGTSDLT